MPENKAKEKKINQIMNLINDGKLNKALEFADVNDLEDLLKIGKKFFQNRVHNIAMNVFDRIIQLAPNDENAWYNKGVVLGDLGKYDEALKCYDKAIKLNPNHVNAWFSKGVALVKLGKHDEALKCYDKATKLNPNDENAWHNKGVVLGELGKYDEVLKCFDKAIKLNPNHVSAWYNKGVALGKLGKRDEELKCYDKEVKLNPNHFSAWYNKGVALGKFGKYDEALKCYDKAIKLNPNYVNTWYNKGVVLGDLRKYDEALKCFDKAIKLNPNHVKAWLNKGGASSELGKYDEALKCFDKAIKLNPNDENAWYNKGVALGKLGKHDEELKCYDKAIKLNPNHVKAWHNKGVALGKLGKHDEELKCYDKAIKLNPNDESAWHNKGVALGKLGKHDEELKCYDKAIKLNPNDESAWHNKGVALGKLGKHDEELKCYDKAIKLNPNDESAWQNKGVVLGELGKYDEALKCFDKAIKLNPKYAEAYANKGITFLNCRKYAEAKDELRKGRKLFSEIKAKENTEKVLKFEVVATNASELLTCLKPLDERFINCLNSRSLIELKNEIFGVSNKIEDITKEFEDKELPEDAYKLLWSKATCFTAFLKALKYEKINRNLLRKAVRIFEIWELDSFVVAVSSLDTFIRFLSKYPSLDKIPKNIEKYLLRGVLGASYILDGELTEEIASKIKAEPFEIKSKGITREPELKYINKDNSTTDWVKVALVQLNYKLEYIPEPFSIILKKDIEKEIKKKIFGAFKIAEEERVNIICFPELSFKKEWVDEIRKFYKDMIIIGGSFYDKNKYNICPIIINGNVLYYRKCHCSIFEESNGEGMNRGDELYIIQTKFGKISVLNCIDFDEELHRILKEKVDIIINPRCDIDKEHTFQKRADIEIELPDGSKLQTFMLHVNAMKVNWGESEGGGGTCIFGYEHKYRIEKYKKDGLRPNDNIKYKICQAMDEMILIADFKIAPSTEKRINMGNWHKYDENKKCWKIIKNKRIWE